MKSAHKIAFELHQCDCVAGMERLPEASVDIVVTSPPYNLGIKYGKYDDSKLRADYLEWCSEWAKQIKRCLKAEGSFFLNVGATPANPLLPHQLALKFSEMFALQNTFHWIKSISTRNKRGEYTSAGHFKPLNSKRYVTDCHEYIFHFSIAGNARLDRLAIGVPYADKTNINRWGHTKGKDLRCRGNNWFIPYETIQRRKSERPHPATFPTALAEHCFRIARADSESIVMDPFLGIGHAALAARNVGVKKFIGYEIDGGYLEVAKDRLNEEMTYWFKTNGG